MQLKDHGKKKVMLTVTVWISVLTDLVIISVFSIFFKSFYTS